MDDSGSPGAGSSTRQNVGASSALTAPTRYFVPESLVGSLPGSRRRALSTCPLVASNVQITASTASMTSMLTPAAGEMDYDRCDSQWWRQRDTFTENAWVGP